MSNTIEVWASRVVGEELVRRYGGKRMVLRARAWFHLCGGNRR